MTEQFRCGFVAVIGRPNVGKSTLVNALVGEKVSITTHKPQTTRHRILGIKTKADYQIVLVDTPGFHLREKQAINRYMNRAALGALHDVDLVLLVVEVGQWGEEEESLLVRLEQNQVILPVFALINKIDTIENKTALLPFIKQLQQRFAFSEVVPLSARTNEGVDRLEELLSPCLPEGGALYDDDQYTDRSLRFIAAELLREQLYLNLRQELPYAITVEIEAFEEQQGINRIAAVIWVAKPGHKGIIIGKQGAGLKRIGEQARLSMEASFAKKVFLNLWVKVKEDWNDNDRILHSLGYQD